MPSCKASDMQDFLLLKAMLMSLHLKINRQSWIKKATFITIFSESFKHRKTKFSKSNKICLLIIMLHQDYIFYVILNLFLISFFFKKKKFTDTYTDTDTYRYVQIHAYFLSVYVMVVSFIKDSPIQIKKATCPSNYLSFISVKMLNSRC